MEKNIAIHEFLAFVTFAEEAAIAQQKGNNGKIIGGPLAAAIVKQRTAAPQESFRTIESLLKVTGMSQALVDTLWPQFVVKERYPGMIASHTLVGLKGGAPDLKPFNGEVILEPYQGAVRPRNPEQAVPEGVTYYELFYSPKRDKEKLLNDLKSLLNFIHFDVKYVFTVQTRHSHYIATIPGTDVYLRDFFWATKLSVRGFDAPAHGYPYSPAAPFPNAFLSLSFNVRNDAGPVGMLSYTPGPSSKVRTVSLATQPVATALEKFDTEGIFLAPIGSSPDYFKSFTLMNYVRANLAPTDPRQFIGSNTPPNSNPNLNYFLVGTGSQAAWEFNHQLRYVDIVENMALKVIHNPTHTAQMGHDAYMAVLPGNVVGVQTVPTGAPVPANAKFDMYVHYGYWGERRNISAKVVIRFRPNLILGVDSTTDDVALSAASGLAAQHFFYIENGWGGGVNHVNLKTHVGKYLKCWNAEIVSDAVVPYIYEQFQVIIP